MDNQPQEPEISSQVVHLPASTAWPVVLALGLMLVFASLVTNPGIAVLGVTLALFGGIGWFRQVLPHEHHEEIAVQVETIPIVTARPRIARIQIDETHRARLPLETYSVMSGVKGGIAGGIAMIVPAIIYGLISHHSIWYPINLLGGAGIPNWQYASAADLSAFNWTALLVATAIHGVTSILVGLLYGAMLPMLPRHPVVLGGVIAPLLWTGLLHSILGIINPFFAARINWAWFLASQFAFGIVAGLVVARQGRVRTAQYLSFAQRIGLETPGLMHERKQDRGQDESR